MRTSFLNHKLLALLLIIAILPGCSTFFKAQNKGIKEYKTGAAYRSDHFHGVRPLEENLIILAFSGGGTRAAALSYGVMQELRDTKFIDSNGKSRTLLSDVDFISSVSGGSFTAAYYGLFGDKLFTDFEKDFLRQSIESSLISKLLNPGYWIKSLWTGFDRTELAIEHYDQTIFKGRTFGDIPLDKRPFIMINATDLSLGYRFSFHQDEFDLLCADLSSFPVARAVTASSAVPIVFPSVVLKNRAGSCDLSKSIKHQRDLAMSKDSLVKAEYLDKLKKYQDAENRKFIHLVDGGIADNLGLRPFSDHFKMTGMDKEGDSEVKRISLILVNSGVKRKREMDTTPFSPPISETLDAFTSALIDNRSTDTRSYFFDQKSAFQNQIKASDPNIELYISEISFEDIQTEKGRRLFNSLPTSLELEDEQIDYVIGTARELLRANKHFKEFKKAIAATSEK